MSRLGDAIADTLSSGLFALTVVTGIAGGIAVGSIVLFMTTA